MDTTSLAVAAQARMEHARSAARGRSAQTVHGGHDRALRQTVVALRAGTRLSEHHSTREATLQVLAGHVWLTTETQAVEAVAGDLLTVPTEAHTLDAVEDSALLLTVALMPGSPRSVSLASRAGPSYSWQEDWE